MGIEKPPGKGDYFLGPGLPSVPRGMPEALEERLPGAQSAGRKLVAVEQHPLIICASPASKKILGILYITEHFKIKSIQGNGEGNKTSWGGC